MVEKELRLWLWWFGGSTGFRPEWLGRPCLIIFVQSLEATDLAPPSKTAPEAAVPSGALGRPLREVRFPLSFSMPSARSIQTPSQKF